MKTLLFTTIISSAIVAGCVGVVGDYGPQPGGGGFGGTYKQSCRNCSHFNGTLSCACLNRHQRWRQSDLERPGRCNFIENINGRLVCTGGKRRHHQPRGRAAEIVPVPVPVIIEHKRHHHHGR